MMYIKHRGAKPPIRVDAPEYVLPRVTQIVPATGYVCVYGNRANEHDPDSLWADGKRFWEVPVVAFAIVEDLLDGGEVYTDVQGLEAGPFGLEFCNENGDGPFQECIGIVRRGDKLTLRRLLLNVGPDDLRVGDDVPASAMARVVEDLGW